jgi:hypothetical protein
MTKGLTMDKAEELVKIKEDIVALKLKFDDVEQELVQLMKDNNQSQISIPGLGVIVTPEYVDAKVKIKIKKQKKKAKKSN